MLRYLRDLMETARSRIWPDGHWHWLHEFKTCPTGDRHCRHYRWTRTANCTHPDHMRSAT